MSKVKDLSKLSVLEAYRESVKTKTNQNDIMGVIRTLYPKVDVSEHVASLLLQHFYPKQNKNKVSVKAK